MKKKRERSKEKTPRITGIGITNDTLTSRGGLSLFVRYLASIGIMSSIRRLFGGIRKSGKGTCVEELFKQVLCNFVDGTSRHLVHFDRLKDDAGYAGAIESRGEMISLLLRKSSNVLTGVVATNSSIARSRTSAMRNCRSNGLLRTRHITTRWCWRSSSSRRSKRMSVRPLSPLPPMPPPCGENSSISTRRS